MRAKRMLGLNEIQIEVRPFDESIKEVVGLIRDISKAKKVKKIERITFDNIETLRKIVTPERVKLMHYIRINHPESIYELAQITGRKWRAVANDIDILSNVGLVKLEKQEKPKEAIKPVVEFEKINIGVSI